MKISKELFEAVMDMKVEELQITTHHVAISVIVDGRYEDYEINDFFFKCKEWALEQGYSIGSYIVGSCEVYSKILEHSTFVADSEQQAVFNACQWILENKDERD